jgi:hypothetical protein
LAAASFGASIADAMVKDDNPFFLTGPDDQISMTKDHNTGEGYKDRRG